MRILTDRLIDSGGFAHALQHGSCHVTDDPDRTYLLQSIATSTRINGLALLVDQTIPAAIHQPFGALVDLAAWNLDRPQGGMDTSLGARYPLQHGDTGMGATDDIAIPADQLTGLAHRTHFIRFLHRVFSDRTPEKAIGAILLDIDRFRHINREFGCDTGDRVLRDVALRLDSALRSQYLYETLGIAECDLCFARTGADEFGVAISRMRYPHRLADIAAYLHSHLSEGFRQEGSRLYLSVSIGVASSSHDPEPSSAQALLRSADTALKRAKTVGRNQHVVYESTWDERGSPHLRTESLLQEALRKDQFTLHFQPLFRLVDQALVGAEVLLRLPIGEGIHLPPSDFIPVAESTGQIIEIGEWVLRRVCRQMHAWDARGSPRIPLSINISAIELSHGDLTRRLGRILQQESTSVERLHIEITETAIARNEEEALANLKALRAAGFEVWIDDFGIGYSSLKSIKNFPISGLKLDREFVKDLARDPTAEVIASTILTMARRLNHPIVAEGIENADQLQFLREQDCPFGQGFHLGHPVCPDVFQASYFPAGTDTPPDPEPGPA